MDLNAILGYYAMLDEQLVVPRGLV